MAVYVNIQLANMLFITPDQRLEQHNEALNSKTSGAMFGLQWKIYPKITKPMEIDDDKSAAASAMASIVYSKPAYAPLSLGIYDELVNKIRFYYSESMVSVIVKGGNALAFYFMGMDDMNETFPFSDLDIVVYVNPDIGNMFKQVHRHVSVIAGQVFGKHKQAIDRAFFRTNGTSTAFPTIDKDEFIAAHINAFESRDLISPFVSDEIRNASSFHSFSILPSLGNDDSVVKISEGHFDFAEKIPLYKTPIACSINKTIDNVCGDRKIKFDLVRMKWGAIGSRNGSIALDFVDCIIPRMGDSDLEEFAKRGGFGTSSNIKPIVTINRLNYSITIPSLLECYNDLWKLINVFEAPESKRAIREEKLSKLSNFINNGMNTYI
jgi:hypothetical protein